MGSGICAIEEFENACISGLNKEYNIDHTESSPAELKTKKKFLKDHKPLLSVVEEGTVINHFKKTGPDLITVDAGEVIDLEIAVWGKPLLWTKIYS